MKQRKTKKKVDKEQTYDYEEDFLFGKAEEDDVKLNFKTKELIKDDFLENLDKMTKEDSKPQSSNYFDLQNKKKDKNFIENKEVKDLDKQYIKYNKLSNLLIYLG